MESFYLALFDARRVVRDLELNDRHHALPRRPKRRFGRRRRPSS